VSPQAPAIAPPSVVLKVAPSDRETDRAHCEIEAPDPAGQVCGHKGSHDTEHGATQPIEPLHENEDIRTRHTREEQGPNRQCDEPEQEHWTPAQAISGDATRRDLSFT
jgi:hypothetical protein